MTTSQGTSPDIARHEQLLFTLDDVAQMLRVSRAEVERAVAQGRCGSLKIGRLRRVSKTQLADYIARLERGEV